ncbi:MAG TPA: N-acyl homoserine lactonase family protein [Burkholderiales bacterium]|nr:N-acyl homoserine lactonase family protein [Burkholderiales bacterium]
MLKQLSMLALGLLAGALIGPPAASAQAGAAELTLRRFDCGNDVTPRDIARWSDAFAYEGQKRHFTFSCYLVRHGDEYLIWDTGFVPGSNPSAPNASLTDQLAQLGLAPDRIKYVGISHYHGDHTGQVSQFPNATLLIGKGDWEAITAPKPAPGVNFPPFEHWIHGGGKVEPVPLDKDVFGDGTVIMLATPGHTPGHHSLLVKLKEKGAVILSGDAAHFHENYDSDGVPSFNTSRAETVASLERLKNIAARLNATVVLQHDTRDVDKLPAFPAEAR